MKYSFLLLIIGVLFYHCDPIVKEGQPDVGDFTVEKMLREARATDSTARMHTFSPDTAAFKFNNILIDEYYPEIEYACKGRVKAVTIAELTSGERGQMKETNRVSYTYENGRVIKIVETSPDDTTIQTFRYNKAGLLVESSKVYPGENDSATLEYQYNEQNSLAKILHFDGLNILVQTSYFYYKSNGTLDSIVYDNSEGESFRYKFLTSNSSDSYLKIEFDEKGLFRDVYYYALQPPGLYVTKESFSKLHMPSVMKSSFHYDEFGDLTKIETKDIRLRADQLISYSYRARDTAGNWTEMLSYVDRNLTSIARRTIIYE